MKKFLIYAPSFTDGSGGVIALHYLCDLINSLGYQSYIHPWIPTSEFSLLDYQSATSEFLSECRGIIPSFNFKIYNKFKTPLRHVLNEGGFDDEWIAIYPEVTSGNPLQMKNVVRWLLHNPGHHTGKINYGKNELHIRFSENFKEFHYPRCKLSKNFLTVSYVDFEIFQQPKIDLNRRGSAYCLRKGAEKSIIHDLNNSILIDGKPLSEVAKIFQEVEYFYSYDAQTTFSQLAVLCGCHSIVIPDDGVPKKEWRKTEGSKFGISYGLDDIDFAYKTENLVEPWLRNIQNEGLIYVKNFVDEALEFFN